MMILLSGLTRRTSIGRLDHVGMNLLTLYCQLLVNDK